MSNIPTLKQFVSDTFILSREVNENFEALRLANNDNFSKIDKNISDISNLTNKIANADNSINNVQGHLQGLISALQDSVTQIESKVLALQSLKTKPNWNAGHILANNITYTVGYGDLAYASDGFVFFRSQHAQDNIAHEWWINGNLVGGSLGVAMKWIDSNSILCRVSRGDTIRATGQLIQFFPAI